MTRSHGTEDTWGQLVGLLIGVLLGTLVWKTLWFLINGYWCWC